MVHVLRHDSTNRLFPAPRIWHLWLLAAYVAVAIVELQRQRTTEPQLIALALAGFAGYALLARLGWKMLGRARDHRFRALVVYLVTMAALLLVATVSYVALENLYRMGHL